MPSSRYSGGLPRWVYRAMEPRPVELPHFRGGINWTGYPDQIGPDELIDAANVHLDLYGDGLSGRFGMYPTASNGWSNGGKSFYDLFWSESLGKGIARCGNGAADWYFLVLNADGTATFTAINVGAPAATYSCWTEFQGKVIVGTDLGIYSLDGAGAWTLLTAAVKPSAPYGSLTTWQNKVWASGDPANPTRISASNAGTAGTWTTATDWVDIREDDTPITCLGGGVSQQMDVLGRPTLLFWKRSMTGRINSANATSGFTYTILSGANGCSGPKAATTFQGVTYFAGRSGIFQTDGNTIPTEISGKLHPFFVSVRGVESPTNLIAAAWQMCAYQGRVYLFTPPFGGTAFLQQCFEYHPGYGAFTRHSFGTDDGVAPAVYGYGGIVPGVIVANATAAYGSATQGGYRMLATWGNGVGTPTVISELFSNANTTSGRDSNVATFQSVVQTPFLSLAGGHRFSLRRMRARMRLHGIGALQSARIAVRPDYADSQPAEIFVSTQTPINDNTATTRPYDVYAMGRMKAGSIRFTVPGFQPAAQSARGAGGIGLAAGYAPAFLLGSIELEVIATGRG